MCRRRRERAGRSAVVGVGWQHEHCKHGESLQLQNLGIEALSHIEKLALIFLGGLVEHAADNELARLLVIEGLDCAFDARDRSRAGAEFIHAETDERRH